MASLPALCRDTAGIVQGDVRITAAIELRTLTGCKGINGSLDITANDATDLGGLETLKTVSGFLSVSQNEAMTSLKGLSSLTSVGGLTIIGNPVLTSLGGLSALTDVASTPAAANVRETERFLIIQDNPALTTLDGLSSLKSVGGGFAVAGNENLTAIKLNTLQSVAGMFQFNHNPAHTTLSFSGVTATDQLVIDGNDALASLAGLENLNAIGGWLNIADNSMLTSLAGLKGVKSVGGSVDIESNAALPQAEAEALANRVGKPCGCRDNK